MEVSGFDSDLSLLDWLFSSVVCPAGYRMGAVGSPADCTGCRFYQQFVCRHPVFFGVLSHRFAGNWLGIGTYLWVLSNKKENRRKGKVQLIDATSFKSPLRRNLGEKNCEITESIRKRILNLYMAFDEADPKYSKVFDNSEFGYWEVPVYMPQLDENGQPVLDKKGKPVKPITDKEQVPFSYEGGIEAFIENEVKPYAPSAYITPGTEKIGYELSFTKYFYEPVKLRTLEEITADIRAIEAETDGLLDEIIGD